MSSENRWLTANPSQVVTAAFLNAIQDNMVMSWQMDGSTLAPTSTWYGATLYYGHDTYTGAGTKITILDASRDWRDRILDVHWVTVGAANQLPRGAAYDANNPTSEDATVWSTETGSTAAAPPLPAAYSWQNPSVAGLWLFVASAAAAPVAAGDLCVSNNTGAGDKFGMLWIVQSPDIS